MKLSILYILFASAIFTSCQERESAAAPLTEDTPTLKELINDGTVSVGELISKKVTKQISCTGRIEIPPVDVTSIHSKIPGQVHMQRVLPGDYVKKGSLIGRVENIDLVTTQRTLIETKIEMDMAQKDFHRKESLLSKNATTERVYEESKRKYDLLNATFNGLKKELDLYGINTVDLLEKQNFQPTINIYAPTSGRVQQVLINNGQRVSPEQALITIANQRNKHLELQILSKDIANISIGQNVSFYLPSDNQEHKARITKLSPLLNQESSTLSAHCHIEGKSNDVHIAGHFVNAVVHSDSVSLTGLPIQAVIKEGENYYGYQYDGTNTIKTLLLEAILYDDFVTFENRSDEQWITKGAYYLE